MKRKLNSGTDEVAIDAILSGEEELIPSSGFVAATMERVREEATIPKPIPFPWFRALPGIVLATGVVSWCGFEAVSIARLHPQEISLTQLHMTAANWIALEPAGWVAAALGISLLSWLLSRRLAGGSGLL